MTKYEMLSIQFTFVTLGISLIGTIISLVAIVMSSKAKNLNIKMFKRQGIIDLHMAWHGVNEINKNKIIGPDVIKAVSALSLTASLWNHDVIEKLILYQSYWDAYKTLYEQLYNLDELVPGKKMTCKSLITSEIVKTYKDMESFDLSKIEQTKLI